jgi:outer membrane protein assembly factor BamA
VSVRRGLALAFLVLACPLSARAQGPTGDDGPLPKLRPGATSDLTGRTVTRVVVEATDPLWPIPEAKLSIAAGDSYSDALARRAARDLSQTGLVAEVTIEAEPDGDGALVRLVATPQRVAVEVRVSSSLDVVDALRVVGVERGRAVTPRMLHDAERAATARARSRGYPEAVALVSARATDDPRAVVVLVEVTAGPARALDGVRVEVEAKRLLPRLRELLARWGVSKGDRADEDELSDRTRSLAEQLRAAGFHRATASYLVYVVDGRTYVRLLVHPGPFVRLKIEGNSSVDGDVLEDLIDLEKEADRSPPHVAQKILGEYQRRGFYDAEVSAEVRTTPDDAEADLVVTVRESPRVRVSARLYPCLTGDRTAKDIGSEIDSFLEEELPGATLLGSVDPALVDASLSSGGATTGSRPAPLELSPRSVYAPDTYDRAVKHVQDLYRAEGHLSALVGPVSVVRRRCDPRSPAGECRPLPLPPAAARCAVDAQGVPLEEPALPPEVLCRPNRAKGLSCEPSVVLRIPVKPGPKAVLYDVVFDGAMAFPEPELLAASGLEPGAPASNVAIEEARRAILDRYRDRGHAFAEVQAAIDLSPDKQRARVRFSIIERQQVLVEQIVIRGNDRTAESVIRARLRFEAGGVYRQSEVRRSEELIATLGTFSSVTIALEDPSIPATRKTVIVTVIERDPQYLEVRPGFSSGEGVRTLLEYGHRNLGGRAISLTFRVQLNYLPDFLIPDQTVTENFDKLPLGKRLERRNTVGVQFPNVFHPNVRLGVDLVDVRTNARDFGLTKEAVIPALSWSPFRQLTGTLGGSVELNDVSIFSGQSVTNYLSQPGISNDLNRLLRVPDGETYAVAQRVSAVWDRRDNPLGATRGTLVAGSVEHVHAYPAADNANTITSDFVRLAGRIGGYVRLTKRGMSFAAILGGGYNAQLLSGSKTYPDRLFFLGGVDTLRGFARDSLVPQDVADQIAADAKTPPTGRDPLTIDKVAIRGGDVYINPRTELRIPVYGALETALFVDAGNVWVEPTRMSPFTLRYAGGSGIRVSTPVGPIALDYGVNLNRRSWEDFGAFHFSIGLFLA